ncbi:MULTISPECIES: MucR family transcriptional regulator [unclassified Xanthobacter]|uniref:MucR family transcriptional regulator n=1 Tax=unclassified Xanthobacter TaxID=2623496 RepID=UPI001F1CDA50|nr:MULTISPECIES: MucR family transcriptional regulator [unclassified Xanthobacter]
MTDKRPGKPSSMGLAAGVMEIVRLAQEVYARYHASVPFEGGFDGFINLIRYEVAKLDGASAAQKTELPFSPSAEEEEAAAEFTELPDNVAYLPSGIPSGKRKRHRGRLPANPTPGSGPAVFGLEWSAKTAPERLSRLSVFPDHLVCLECGQSFTSLTKHLRATHEIEPEAYLRKWRLPSGYPLICSDFHRERQAHAKESLPRTMKNTKNDSDSSSD